MSEDSDTRPPESRVVSIQCLCFHRFATMAPRLRLGVREATTETLENAIHCRPCFKGKASGGYSHA